MNKLLFILPSAPTDLTGALSSFRELTAFLDHERYEAYWDEAEYKALRGKIDKADRVTQGLLRMQVQSFTDYKYLPPVPARISVKHGENDIADSIYGRFALHMLNLEKEEGNVAIVNLIGDKIPAMLNVLKEGKYVKSIPTSPIITDCAIANEWFASYRLPKRVFNPEYRHGKKEYTGTGGKTVSPLNIDASNIEYALHHAVGCKTTTRLIHHCSELGLYIIFSYENRVDADKCPVYHGHQFAETDTGEMNRLPVELTKKLRKLNKKHDRRKIEEELQ